MNILFGELMFQLPGMMKPMKLWSCKLIFEINPFSGIYHRECIKTLKILILNTRNLMKNCCWGYVHKIRYVLLTPWTTEANEQRKLTTTMKLTANWECKWNINGNLVLTIAFHFKISSISFCEDLWRGFVRLWIHPLAFQLFLVILIHSVVFHWRSSSSSTPSSYQFHL